jgi:hypothetical protein
MKHTDWIPGLLAAAAVCAFSTATAQEAPVANARLGMNLAGPADWNTELPLVDVFRMSRPWISQREGAAWGKGPALDLDAQGWVRKLEPGCSAETFLCTIDGGHYPAGDYTVLYDGDGKFNFAQAVTKVVSTAPGRIVIRVDPMLGAINIRLVQTNPANPARNIRVIMPGFEKTYATNPWHPVFLKRWQGVSCLRFMDFQQTNNSKQRKWPQRPKPGDATFAERGLPVELLVDLANRLHCDAWFCIPHMADDDYVRNFAAVVKHKLAPGLRAWVEYSNEVWNGQFEQNAYAGEQGRKLGFATQPWEAAWRFHAYRSTAIFKIWEQVFGGHERIVRVLASQMNDYVSEVIASFQDAATHADALAIAPYFGFVVPSDPAEKINESVVSKWSVDKVLDHISKVTLPETLATLKTQKAVADKHGLRLVAYEAGQHLVGTGGAENNDTLTALLESANRHPRMATIYRRYLDGWTAAGGDLVCHFSSVSSWSKWGSWGVLEYFDEDEAKSPKLGAIRLWAASRGQNISGLPLE